MTFIPLDNPRIKELYTNQGVPAYKIAILFGTSKTTILDRLKTLNIPRRATGFQKGNQYGNKTKGIKGKPHSEETKKKISVAHKGRILSEAHRKRLSEALRGEKNPRYGKPLPAEHRKAISDGEKGRNFSLTDRIKLSAARRKIPLSEWNGFTHPEQLRFRGSEEYREWKKAVLRRDNYQCQICGTRKGKLHGHHIREFSNHPELRLSVDNGITLCKPCHEGVHRGRPKPHSVEHINLKTQSKKLSVLGPKPERVEVPEKEE